MGNEKYREQGEPTPLNPLPRASALAFTEGSRADWTLHELVVWVDRHLVRAGRLLRRGGRQLTIRESGAGVLSFGSPSLDQDPVWYQPQSHAPRVIETARRRIIEQLQGLMREPPDDGFVHAAIYAGRVSRETSRNGHRVWKVLVDERDNLSEQVLALFSSDLLANRCDYEKDLVICEVCESVSFWPAPPSRRGCAMHPAGLVLSPYSP